MRADTQTVTIQAVPEAVLGFVADGANLPRWAIGFAKSVARSGDAWVVTTGQGAVPTTISCDDAAGTVDFRMDMGLDADSVAYTRVLPNEAGTEFVFTQFQEPHVLDDVFEQLVAAVGHELTTLKAILEVECPL
jgi:Polyketide cyclase / dehydrase and lipid transport